VRIISPYIFFSDDNFGYWIGREIGFRVLLRYGSYMSISSLLPD
jgi:hypothetical protein